MLDLIVILVTASSIKGFNGQSEQGHVSALLLFPISLLGFYFISMLHQTSLMDSVQSGDHGGLQVWVYGLQVWTHLVMCCLLLTWWWPNYWFWLTVFLCRGYKAQSCRWSLNERFHSSVLFPSFSCPKGLQCSVKRNILLCFIWAHLISCKLDGFLTCVMIGDDKVCVCHQVILGLCSLDVIKLILATPAGLSYRHNPI